ECVSGGRVASLCFFIGLVVMVYRVRDDPRFRSIPEWAWGIWTLSGAALAFSFEGGVRYGSIVVASACFAALIVRGGVRVWDGWRLKPTWQWVVDPNGKAPSKFALRIERPRERSVGVEW